jgi:hypothetical protein
VSRRAIEAQLNTTASSHTAILSKASTHINTNMKFSHVAFLTVFSTLAAASPLRVTVIIDDEPDTSPAVAATEPIEWIDCGDSSNVFQLKNVTITPNPPVS